MEVNCEGCAGCCIDWTPLADRGEVGSESPYEWIGASQNFTPLRRSEVREYVRAGLADALTVVLVAGEEGGPTVDGTPLEAVQGRPLFQIGLRKTAKPIAPFGGDPTWLESCVFLDPETLQCRIHGDDRYPENCAVYPGANLDQGMETECERVEDSFGGERLVDGDPPADLPDRPTDWQALGRRVFTYPSPGQLSGVVDRLREGRLPRPVLAEFVAVAAASKPESLSLEETWYEYACEKAAEADSWVGGATDAWERKSRTPGSSAPERPPVDESSLGAPETPGWE